MDILEGFLVKENCDCQIGVVYGANDRGSRREVYEEISQVLNLCSNHNEVLHISKRRGQKNISESMEDFRKWIDECFLIDVPIKNMKYTWKRGQS